MEITDTAMETLKAVVATLLSPLLISLILQLCGWILYARRKPACGRWLLAAGTAVLFLGGLSGFTFESQRSAEWQYLPLELETLPAGPLQILVLGTGFNPDPELPANSRVGGTFLSRLLEGLRVLRARPDAELIVSVAGRTPAADKVRFWQELQPILGLEDTEAKLITDAESTLDEAQLVKTLNSGQPIVLATSAGHMPRAVRIFEDEGLTVHPAPTDYGFIRSGSAKDHVWERWIPSTAGLGSNHAWLYETVADLWQTIRTQFRQPPSAQKPNHTNHN